MSRSEKRAPYGSKLPAALLERFRAAGPDACAICLKALPKARRVNQRICVRQKCRDRYAELYQQGQPKKRARVARLEPYETPGRVVVHLSCGHRLIVWRARADRSRRCPLCARGARRNAKALDTTRAAA